MSNRTTQRMAIYLFTALAALVLMTKGAMAQEPPFDGEVTADKVQARSGAGQTHYAVLTLDAGSRVRVLRNVYGWCEIAPPAASFSYIARTDVKYVEGAETGEVVQERAPVRAPSPAGADAGNSYKIQLKLTKGDKVRVLGAAGEFYKITPPEGATLFIHQDFIRVAKAEEPQVAPKVEPKVEPTPAPAEKPEAPKSTVAPPAKEEPKPAEPEAEMARETVSAEVQLGADGTISFAGNSMDLAGFNDALAAALAESPDLSLMIGCDKQASPEAMTALVEAVKASGVKKYSVVPQAVVAVEPTVPDESMNPQPPAGEGTKPAEPSGSPKLEDLELRFADAGKMPLREQPLSELKIGYEFLLASDALSPEDRALVKQRMKVVEYRSELQARLSDIASLRQQIDLARKQREEAEKRRPKSYSVVGKLATSTLYTGDKLPLLYRVTDPSSGLTLAYVTPATNAETARSVGQFVGVIGAKEFDSTLQLHVVKTEQVDELKPR